MTTPMLSIDPGVRNLGAAAWGADGELLGALCSRQPTTTLGLGALAYRHVQEITEAIGGPWDLGIMESMVWTGVRATTPQDLIDVQTVGALVVASLASEWQLLPPSLWKATIPKEIHHERILAGLTARERAIATTAAARAGACAKEVLDAIGIGLYALGRTDRSGNGVRK